MQQDKQQEWEKRIDFLRASGFEISPAIKKVIENEISLAVAEREKEIVEMIKQSVPKYPPNSEREKLAQQQIVEIILSLITKEK